MRPILLALLLLLPACKQEAPPPRPVVQAASIEGMTHDSRRVLALEGGRNFRDLGGYRTNDGHAVKWRMLFRSGSPADLTAKDMTTLNGLGIRTVCDLRSTQERQDEPNRWVEQAKL